MSESKQAVILVGGKGKRLKHETKITPKPLVQISNDKNILDFILNKLISEGFTDLIFLAGFMGHEIKNYLNHYQPVRKNIRIRCLIEKKPLGTAGCLSLCKDILDESFFLLNGDSWFSGEIGNLRFNESSTVGKIILKSIENADRYGSVVIGNNGKVISFLEKAQRDEANINIGIYLLSKNLLSFIPKSKFISMENDIFPMLVKKGILEAEIREGKFIDIGTPDSLNYARENIEFFES